MSNKTLKVRGLIHANNSTFGRYNSLAPGVSFNNSSLGDYSYISADSHINFTAIGKFTCIGPEVKIGLGTHPTSVFVSVHPAFYSGKGRLGKTFADREYFKEFQRSYIGNDVWIGNNATILPGIKIGDGAIIGTNSLVTTDVEPYTIVGGNPAKEIRKRFDEETIQLLLALKWWDWDIQKITDNLDVITHGNISELKQLYEKNK